MSYLVVSKHPVPLRSEKETLLAAAKLAFKFQDNVAGEVDIYDSNGLLIPREVWEAALLEWAKTTRPSDIGL